MFSGSDKLLLFVGTFVMMLAVEEPAKALVGVNGLILATWFSWNGEFGDLRLFKPPALELDKPVAPRPTPMNRLIGLNSELDEDDSDFSLARCCGMY